MNELTGSNGGEQVAYVLAAQGVRFVFTLCGGHISPILVSCYRAGIRVIDCRHEATAVFAADAVARLGDTVGVAIVTAGPGITNTVTAVQNARYAQSPVVLIGGAPATVLRGRGALQEMDALTLMRPLVKQTFAVRWLRDLVPALEAAITVARSAVPGPVFVECPVDLLYPTHVVADWFDRHSAGVLQRMVARQQLRRLHHVPRRASQPWEPPPYPRRAASGEVREASRRLARARRPVLLIGSQATAPASRVDAVAAAADALGTPVFLSGMARGLMGRDHARLFRHCRRQALRDADLVILIGVPCDFRLGYGHHISRRAAVIAANSSAAELVLNRKPSLAVQADAGAFLMDLACAHAGCSREASWHDWMDSLRRHEHERQATIDRQVRADATPLDPLYLCQRLEATMGDDSIMIGDGGDFVATASYLLRPRRPLSWLDPGPFGTLGAGAGFAIGAALSRPQSEVWLLYGDGAAAYSLAEFDTCVRHGIPLVAVVGNDAAWSQIARDQLAVLGDDVATKLRRTDYHTVAMGYGGGGLLLDAPGDIDRVLAQAGRMAAQGGPVLINAQLGANAFRSGSMSL